eukprot:CAMPEP_0197034448 /NCGR_PEP_ID=MMETSP1384-20130603/12568_1 /TAXON_ID=29189 /ORGANISM="Ammonia sp." /LENGTH=445 /DNA_ID=CAMNT_0042464385 /DNA_START=18 /DNA_END=1355 /DNA_ORIENTATION=+
MAVNAIVVRNGIPVPVQREQFLHMDEGLSIEIGSNAHHRGKGKIYLTNLRLIFLKRDPTRDFSSFSVPYLYATKLKYGKKLIGGPTISGCSKTIVNGGLDSHSECKFQLQFSDTNSAKSFYTLLDKELTKLANLSDNVNKYKRVTNTPSLPIEEIFPDQYAAYRQQQQQKLKQASNRNIVITNANNPAKQQIVVGQSAQDAPMKLTGDYRAQKANLFASKQASPPQHLHDDSKQSGGVIAGASPVNIAAFSKYRGGKTIIEDESTKWSSNAPPPHAAQHRSMNAQKANIAAAAAADYNAYVDPANPDDIVISVPLNDAQFDQQEEGKMDDGDAGYDEQMIHDFQHKQAKQKSVPVAVSVDVNDVVDEEDDFNQRRQSKYAASVSIAPPPKSKKAKAKAIDTSAEHTVSSKKKKQYDQLSPSHSDSILDAPLLSNDNNNVSGWQQF